MSQVIELISNTESLLYDLQQNFVTSLYLLVKTGQKISKALTRYDRLFVWLDHMINFR